MNIVVNDQVHLAEFRASDKDALVGHLNDREIYDRTLRIPFPYTDATADEWLALVAKITEQQGRQLQFAIRSADDSLIGGCGFDGFQVGKSHRAEVGYWPAKPFWGRGIMTAVVQRVCQHAFQEYGLAKFTAHVFSHNPASARVLEKCGFQQEGYLRKHWATPHCRFGAGRSWGVFLVAVGALSPSAHSGSFCLTGSIAQASRPRKGLPVEPAEKRRRRVFEMAFARIFQLLVGYRRNEN